MFLCKIQHILTLRVEGQWAGRAVWMMAAEKFMMESGRAVAKFELPFSARKVGEARGWLVEAAGTQVHREASHFPRTSEERAPPHRGELFKSSLFTPLVLKPDL